MKLTIGLVALALQLTGVVAGRTPDEVAALTEKCGDLGVQQVPEGADPANYRDCANHPLGNNYRTAKEQSLSPEEGIHARGDVANMKGADIFKRKQQACEWNSREGCSGGYCWKSCGSPGEWCWTAAGDGGGPWLQCRSYNDCNFSANCGKGCKPGNNSCGCSC
ncbi:hypothetical protein BU24DRAFT_451318 [Aaosphaeria arxii CBS 175.79]|uniref:IDI-2 n=1 Tax=Aaosphaeria arxii CBS 175.79 TaxID=1450172 RepID=A0A6A5XMQ8_9PLEO|nr:uncharacterized protein BU24DRAFT_451318 [Aaosphaeria arxii CBS 175.79]KAF2014196.1 hypothetical protein BU24DRAFT_451318 [Aaosphaeria arxii CBS 175.79]